MELNEYYKRRRNGESNLDLIAEVATTQGTDNFFNSITEEDRQNLVESFTWGKILSTLDGKELYLAARDLKNYIGLKESLFNANNKETEQSIQDEMDLLLYGLESRNLVVSISEIRKKVLKRLAEISTASKTPDNVRRILFVESEEDYYEKEARQAQKVGIDAYFASPSLPLILNSLTRDKIYELHKNESIDDLQFAELERACEIRSQYFLSYDDKTPRDEQEFVNATNKLRGLLVTKESLREEIEKCIADMTESGKHPKEKK